MSVTTQKIEKFTETAPNISLSVVGIHYTLPVDSLIK